MISVMRKKITPMKSSASFEPSPAPNHISNSGMKAGAGRKRQALTNGLKATRSGL